MSKHYTVLAKL